MGSSLGALGVGESMANKKKAKTAQKSKRRKPPKSQTLEQETTDNEQ